MAQAAKAQEPSMEEILASIRRIIADDDATKGSDKPAEQAKAAPAQPQTAPPKAPPQPAPPKVEQPVPPPKPKPSAPAPAPAAPAPQAKNNQDDIDAMLAELDATPAPAAPALSAETAEKDDILDLTESMEAPAQPPGFRTIDGNSDVMFEEAEPAPAPPRAPPAKQSMVDLARQQFEHELGSSSQGLLSPGASVAVDSAFNSLAHTVLIQNARTLEDLVREMLRPMLKAWLDDNLPGMVERMVRAEIERVSRGRK
jgi:hypothetical protein